MTLTPLMEKLNSYGSVIRVPSINHTFEMNHSHDTSGLGGVGGSAWNGTDGIYGIQPYYPQPTYQSIPIEHWTNTVAAKWGFDLDAATDKKLHAAHMKGRKQTMARALYEVIVVDPADAAVIYSEQVIADGEENAKLKALRNAPLSGFDLDELDIEAIFKMGVRAKAKKAS